MAKADMPVRIASCTAYGSEMRALLVAVDGTWPDRLKMQYRIDGADEWSVVGVPEAGVCDLRVGGLEEGDHTLEVRAVLGDDVWESGTAEFLVAA